MGSLHMTIQNVVLIETLMELGSDPGWCSRNNFSIRTVLLPSSSRMAPPRCVLVRASRLNNIVGTSIVLLSSRMKKVQI